MDDMSNFCLCHIKKDECAYCDFDLKRMYEITTKKMIEIPGEENIKVEDVQFLILTIERMYEYIDDLQDRLNENKEVK